MGGNQEVSSRCVREAMRRVAVNMNGRRGPKLGTRPFTHLVGELLAHGHRRARELDDTSVPDEGGHQGGHQSLTKAIHGHQSSSELLRAHQSSSELIRLIRAHQRPSELIRASQSSSELIRAHQRPSAHPSRGCRAPKKCSVRNRRPNLAEKIASRCRSIASFKVSSSRDEPLASDEL